MPRSDRLNPLDRKLSRWLLLAYFAFIIYGSFIPFEFTSDPASFEEQWTRFISAPYAGGVRQFSFLDAFSNILLFLPFGFLWIASGIRAAWASGMSKAFVAGALLGAGLGLVIEVAQLFSPARTASLIDVFCNSVGSGAGAAIGYVVFKRRSKSLARVLARIIKEDPTLLVLGFLSFGLLADAYYPFRISLDVSTVWHNVKSIEIIPFRNGFHRFWLDLLVERILFFAAVAYLVWRKLSETGRGLSRFTTVIGCSGLALAIEAGKLFFEGRVPSFENAIISIVGVLCGIFLVPRLAETRFIRLRMIPILIMFVTSVLVYAELTPFEWIRSAGQLEMRIAVIEWLPFLSYYEARPEVALFDLAQKLFLLLPFGFLIALSNRDKRARERARVAATAGFVLGLVLETAQIALRSRNPSITDVLIFTAGAWLGALVFERYLRIISANANL